MAQKLETFQISYILFALVLNALPCIYLTINYLPPPQRYYKSALYIIKVGNREAFMRFYRLSTAAVVEDDNDSVEFLIKSITWHVWLAILFMMM